MCFPVLLATSFLALLELTLLEGFRRRVRQFLNASLWLLRRSFTGIFWAAVSSFGCALQPFWPRRFQLLNVTLYFTLHTLHFLLHSIRDTLRSTLCTLHSTLHTFHPALYTSHSTLYNPHFTLYTLHSSLNTRLSSHSTDASSSGSAGGSPSITLCNIFTPFNTWCDLCKLGLEGGILGDREEPRAKQDDNNYSHM